MQFNNLVVTLYILLSVEPPQGQEHKHTSKKAKPFMGKRSKFHFLCCVVITFLSFSYNSVFCTSGRRFVKKNMSKCTSKTQPTQPENPEMNQSQEASNSSVTPFTLQIKTEPEEESM